MGKWYLWAAGAALQFVMAFEYLFAVANAPRVLLGVLGIVGGATWVANAVIAWRRK